MALGAAPAMASNLLYFGGPVVHAARVILVKWGAHVRASYTNPRTGDPAFLNYLSSQDGSTSDIGGVLAQYMDTSGHNSHNLFSFGGTVQISPTVAATPPGKVFDSQIQSNLTRAIKAGTVPAPTGQGGLSTIYVVLFPPGDNVCFDSGGCAYNGGGFCGYHASFQLSGASTQILYAPIVDSGPGTPNFGNCGVGVSSDVGNQTSVVSHEVSESINDPLDAVASWYDYSVSGEIADKCDAQPPARNGPWTVESLWSDRERSCLSGEPAFRAPTASFLASSTGTAGQKVTFNASSSSDPSGDRDTALNQSTDTSYSISSGLVSYHWNWGDGTPQSTSGAATASHTFAAAGNYQVSLTVTDRLGFTSTRTQGISIAGGNPATPFTTTPLPGVRTGGAADIRSSSAVLSGWVSPHRTDTTYQVQFGRSKAYGYSTTWIDAGSSSATEAEHTVLFGLAAGVRYHYRFVTQNRWGTTVGDDRTFTSALAPRQAPRFGLSAPSRLSDQLLASGRLTARFHCSQRCVAHLVVVAAPPSGARQQALEAAIGRGRARLRRAGQGVVAVRLSSRFRRRLLQARHEPLRLVVDGYASSPGAAPSPPRQATITVY
jgi:PKD repeat protein